MSRKLSHWKGWGASYHRRLERVFKSIVPPDQRILELGCGEGELLAALKPSFGVGVDLAHGMLRKAKKAYPELHFIQADAHRLQINGPFDFVILSDLINELWDLQTVLRAIRSMTHERSRIIINMYNRMWEIPLSIAEKLGLAKPNTNLNWFTPEDAKNALDLENFETIRHWPEILLPIPIPVLSHLFNRFLVRLWPLRLFALTNLIVARPIGTEQKKLPTPQMSVIIPARNEAGNIDEILTRISDLSIRTEVVFVEGHSRDETYEVIQNAIRDYPELSPILLKQEGEGKGDAVRHAFDHASGDILVILDADISVPPENLVRCYEILSTGKGDFVNGVRLVYPIEEEAMRFFNLLGNKFFSLAFSWLMGQDIKDTLCGTKALWKQDYELIAKNRSYFGTLDPFGDFDLLLGAARLQMKIVDLPIRYRRRSYGSTNIRRWEHGWLLFRMLFRAAMKLKFI